MRSLTQSLFAAIIATLTLFMSPLTLAKDKIVINLQQDPLENPASACVALQLGTGLLVTKKADVTIFASLDGVAIANSTENDNLGSCFTLSEMGTLNPNPVPLTQIREAFLEAGGEILACPLCWVIKYGDLPRSAADLVAPNNGEWNPAQVYIDSPFPLLIKADKVIDY